MVGVDAERAPEVCAISVTETENSALADIDDTVEDAQADIARGVQRAALATWANHTVRGRLLLAAYSQQEPSR